ncbi:non-ribosomal peptide synthetase [Paenibacillus tepidiphilus]|uniref:non-ribosomal peptide synthetase n=1 Tax=Paenibacillus tepidiphilus TaxID=2608683 RepID=UPI00123A8B0A|nr:non-ribosomal peptide synthetase [Paenibacillus tepidiphilus]
MQYGLTQPQTRIWNNERIYGNPAMHNILGLVRIRKNIRIEKLSEAIELFIANHAGVTLQIHEHNGEPMQVFKAYEPAQIDFFDFSSADDPAASFEQWLDRLRQTGFTLLNGPLYYFAMFKIGSNDMGYVGKFHHIISDGWSLQIAGESIARYYSQLINDAPCSVEAAPSYVDVIEQEQVYLQSERFLKNKSFWNDKFAVLPETMAIANHRETAASRKTCTLDSSLSAEIRTFIAEHRLSVNSLFISSVLIYMHAVMNEDDAIIGTPVLNRSGKKEKNTFGMFASTMPFRKTITETAEIGTFLRETARELMGCYVHQKYPYNLLAGDLNLQKQGHEALFDLCVNYYSIKFSPDFDGSPYENTEIFNGNQPYKLQIVIRDWEEDGRIAVDFDYRIQEYSEIQIDKLGEQLLNIIRFIISKPHSRICDIALLTPQEHHELIHNLNATSSPYPSAVIITRMFEEQVERSGLQTACRMGEASMSYSVLNERANRLARFLRGKRIGAGSVVGIASPHSFELITAILAVLKAGGAYLPVDPHSPADRIRYMLEDSGAVLLLRDEALTGGFSLAVEEYILQDEAIYEEDGANLSPVSGPGDLAYIIYTSGSTGQPKGVMVHQQGLVNYIYWANKTYTAQDPEVFALYSSIAFDLTVTSIFTPLIGGHQIVIYRDDSSEFVLQRIIREQQASIVKLTPAHLSLLQDMNFDQTKVKTFIVGGEDLKVSLAKRIYENFRGNLNIFNEYGPTETVVGCMIHRYDYTKDQRSSVPIGLPADNVMIYILDRSLRPAPVLTKGEIYISGDGVALGYRNKPELTAQKFVDNPFISGKKMYRTGDVGMWLENGVLEYKGRIDSQVKVRGYRIELGEIANVLSEYIGILQTAVKLLEHGDGSKYICAYYQSNQEISEVVLETYLYSRLPGYMIPHHLIRVPSFPVTQNGKIDVKQLPAPSFSRHSAAEPVQARDNREAILSDVWKEVLKLPVVGIFDDFYALGGDSIKAIQIASRLHQRGIQLLARDIMAYRNIAKLAMHAVTQTQSPAHSTATGEISFTPIVSWFLNQQLTAPHRYTQTVLLRLTTPAAADVLEQSFRKLITHHDALRLSFTPERGLFYNDALSEKQFSLLPHTPGLNGTASNEDERHHVFKQLIGQLDISSRLPIGAALIDYPGRQQELLIVAHHLVIDGISWRIILEDLFNVYRAIQENTDIMLPDKTASYQEYAAAVQSLSESESIRQERNYWLEAAENRAVLPLRYGAETADYASRQTVTGELTEAATEALQREGVRAFQAEAQVMLLAALSATLRDWAGLEDFTYEIEHHGRHLDALDVTRTVGWFTTMYPLRIRAEGTSQELITHVKEQLRSVPNQGIGYGILKYLTSELPRDKGPSQLRFNYLGSFDSQAQSGDYIYAHDAVFPAMAEYEALTAVIEINCMIAERKLHYSIQYSQNNFNRGSMEEFNRLYSANLVRLIDLAASQSEISFTPSDFEFAGVSQQDLDTLFE